MGKNRVLEQFNCEIEPDKDYAQILIKTDTTQNSAEVAKKIMEDLEIHIIETKYVDPDRVLFKLEARDIRNLALKMSEYGFLGFEAINALPLKIQ